MSESELSLLANMRDCWITGGVAADLAPAEWKEFASPTGDDRERVMLAIAGQAFDVAFRPVAPKSLIRRAPLPRLSLPTLPERLRATFRGALKQASDGGGKKRVAALAASRGFVAHPFDWMPSASETDMPRVYAPWVDWQVENAGGKAAGAEALTVENWSDFYPAARRIALVDLRRSDSAAARALLEAKVGEEPAESRLALVELLRVNLTAADAPYLRSLATDRSGKVKQLAVRLLARIGEAGTSGDNTADVAELAAFIEQRRAGLLRRRMTYAPLELKSQAQVKRRTDLFGACQFIELAAALVASEEELVAEWQFGDKSGADREFAAMVSASGSDAAVELLAERLLSAGDIPSSLQLLPRLGDAQKQEFVEAALAGEPGILGLLGGALDMIEPGTFSNDVLLRSKLYKNVRSAIAGSKERLNFDFSIFGYLATAVAAEEMLADLNAAGLGSADPSLSLLRFNAALGEPTR